MNGVNSACTAYGEQLNTAASKLAEKAGLSIAEAAEYISKAMQTIQEELKTAFEEITQMFEQISECEILDFEPRAIHRKLERERARMAEQIYRTKIKQFERAKPFGRIYKPP